MLWMIGLGIVALFIGGMLIISPGGLIKMNQDLNRLVVRIDDMVMKYRVGVGVSLILAGLFLFLYAYMMGMI